MAVTPARAVRRTARAVFIGGPPVSAGDLDRPIGQEVARIAPEDADASLDPAAVLAGRDRCVAGRRTAARTGTGRTAGGTVGQRGVRRARAGDDRPGSTRCGCPACPAWRA